MGKSKKKKYEYVDASDIDVGKKLSKKKLDAYAKLKRDTYRER